MRRRQVGIGLLGLKLDQGAGANRWDRWRPTVSLFQHEDLLFDRFELIFQCGHEATAEVVARDIAAVSPQTEVRCHGVRFTDPWDFEEVFAAFYEFASGYPFDTDRESYLVNITTGTHVAQICLFLLTESRHFPARLIQAVRYLPRSSRDRGRFEIIDLDLSRYDRLASRFQQECTESVSFLKSGIDTRNERFNRLIEGIETVAVRSREPILLTGPTGAGKSHLARRIYDLKRSRNQVEGQFVEVNCATLRGDAALSTLFGHVKGAFTGALNDRRGLLRTANRGILFLDEIGELGADEQAMLLRALEEKRFAPVGSDAEIDSDFQLIAGTNRDLLRACAEGRFRDDLLSRIHLWSFELPGLSDRREDIDPNLSYELDRFARRHGARVTFNREARDAFLDFATSTEATWKANFRDLGAAVTRLATLSQSGRIDVVGVTAEIARLKRSWREEARDADTGSDVLTEVLGRDAVDELDRFDRVQLADVIRVCRQSRTLAEAGRTLFAASRQRRTSPNDSDRLRKYLKRFGLSWDAVT